MILKPETPETSKGWGLKPNPSDHDEKLKLSKSEFLARGHSEKDIAPIYTKARSCTISANALRIRIGTYKVQKLRETFIY